MLHFVINSSLVLEIVLSFERSQFWENRRKFCALINGSLGFEGHIEPNTKKYIYILQTKSPIS